MQVRVDVGELLAGRLRCPTTERGGPALGLWGRYLYLEYCDTTQALIEDI